MFRFRLSVPRKADMSSLNEGEARKHQPTTRSFSKRRKISGRLKTVAGQFNRIFTKKILQAGARRNVENDLSDTEPSDSRVFNQEGGSWRTINGNATTATQTTIINSTAANLEIAKELEDVILEGHGTEVLDIRLGNEHEDIAGEGLDSRPRSQEVGDRYEKCTPLHICDGEGAEAARPKSPVEQDIIQDPTPSRNESRPVQESELRAPDNEVPEIVVLEPRYPAPRISEFDSLSVIQEEYDISDSETTIVYEDRTERVQHVEILAGSHFLPNLTCLAACTHLETLSIEYDAGRRKLRSSDVQFTGISKAPLKSLTLTQYFFPWSASIYEGLSTLRLDNVKVKPSTSEFLAILDQCPCLERLELISSGPRIVPDAERSQLPTIKLSHLRELEIRCSTEDYSSFGRYLQIPSDLDWWCIALDDSGDDRHRYSFQSPRVMHRMSASIVSRVVAIYIDADKAELASNAVLSTDRDERRGQCCVLHLNRTTNVRTIAPTDLRSIMRTIKALGWENASELTITLNNMTTVSHSTYFDCFDETASWANLLGVFPGLEGLRFRFYDIGNKSTRNIASSIATALGQGRLYLDDLSIFHHAHKGKIANLLCPNLMDLTLQSEHASTFAPRYAGEFWDAIDEFLTHWTDQRRRLKLLSFIHSDIYPSALSLKGTALAEALVEKVEFLHNPEEYWRCEIPDVC